MQFERMKPFWIGATVFGVLFAILISVRLNLFDSPPIISPLPVIRKGAVPAERDIWMNVFQDSRKIGFSRSRMIQTPGGYELEETVQMKINTMGMVQDLALHTRAALLEDLSLSAFEFRMNSGRFRFSAEGSQRDHVLSIRTESGGHIQQTNLEMENRIYLPASLFHFIGTMELASNRVFSLLIFDPVSLGQETINIQLEGKEDIRIMGKIQTAHKVSVSFKGNRQLAWIDEKGEILKESGLLGMVLERTTRADALFGIPMEASQDLTQVASIASNIIINTPSRLNRLTARIVGIDPENLSLTNFRQTYENHILTVIKESIPAVTALSPESDAVSAVYRVPAPLIQSNHPEIQQTAQRITAHVTTPLKKIERIMDWMDRTIEKRPVLSVPDALSTLKYRMGDCNEHSLLFAALARAAGIPAAVEVGLVYLRGRFYYHAWNLVHIGKWVSVDALFNQMPADVTHIRFVGGSDNLPMNLVGIIGNIKIHILNVSE